MNKVQCEKCEVCETTENVKYYETSNQNWCEVCAEQIACPECGCWYFAEDGLVCSGCAVDESEDDEKLTHRIEFPNHEYCKKCDCCEGCGCCECGEDEDKDGMEDCEWCGHTHHYEDKCRRDE